MKAMIHGFVLGALCLVAAGCDRSGEAPATTQAPVADKAQLVARGQYLVEGVAMCQDCHTPMGPQGPDRAQWLQGAELPFVATVEIPGWASIAPAIAGLPSYTDEETIRLLTTGSMPDGSHLGPPMPHYRMNRDDATAVVAYLRSLAP